MRLGAGRLTRDLDLRALSSAGVHFDGLTTFDRESLRMTIGFEQGDDSWIVASIPAVPGANSQGRTREEARANVIDALRGIRELRFAEHAELAASADSEPLELVIGA